jgi:hypothetical protein
VILISIVGIIFEKVKVIENNFNDKRMSLINDMVVGIRTIKCYAWENHYIEKVTEIRKKQLKYTYCVNAIV